MGTVSLQYNVAIAFGVESKSLSDNVNKPLENRLTVPWLGGEVVPEPGVSIFERRGEVHEDGGVTEGMRVREVEQAVAVPVEHTAPVPVQHAVSTEQRRVVQRPDTTLRIQLYTEITNSL